VLVDQAHRVHKEAEFTADEEKKFSIYIRKGYNERYHPKSVHEESAAASDLEMPAALVSYTY
jgi:hypothetical protein